MTSLEIRQKFFDFFIKNHHTKVQSSSLIPAQDPTLLFANAGMNQFKDIFLGKEIRSYTRAVSIQKCIRAGGKHNDLDNVGFTKRHLTFFEMMGNFSFGDYFKKDAIQFAWDFLVKELSFNPQHLYISVFREDDEAYEIWHKIIGLIPDHIVRLGEADNFWQMGDTGPCGPCSEIYVDRGSHFGCGSTSCAPGCSCDRFLEVWNLVFMQFDRQTDGTLKPLKQKGVDTGMGLERLCSIVQNKDSVFETDLFDPLIKHLEKLSGKKYTDPYLQPTFNVVADHIRSCSLAIADGAIPSNEGRGYVVRKIVRRAALFAQKLGDINFFFQLAPAFIKQMSHIYPELATHEGIILKLLTSEVEKFARNLINGQAILERYFVESPNKTITGEQAFKLYDTYGFPLELTHVIARERGFIVDTQGFEREMEQQRMQSGKKIAEVTKFELDHLTTEFTGYEELETSTTISGLVVNNELVNQVPAQTRCFIITPRSPFYVECGGQISDQGFVQINNHKISVLSLKKFNNAIAIEIETPHELLLHMPVQLSVDAKKRRDTMKNHTATHLLQAALIQILGKHVKQSGSLVAPDYLRFDFICPETPSTDQIKQIEDLVNAKIQENIPLVIEYTTLKEATNRGVIAFFGEKYNPERVRVVQIPSFSAELCGGTHVRATGDIGCFKITEISALSAGNKRIVAVTGPKAVELFQENFATVKSLSQEFKVKPTDVFEAIKRQQEQLKVAQQTLKITKKEFRSLQIPGWLAQTVNVDSMSVLYLVLKDSSAEEIRELAIELAYKKPGLYFLVQAGATQSSFAIAMSPEFAQKLDLQKFKAFLTNEGLRCGGTATILQGGGAPVMPTGLKERLFAWLQANLKT